MKSLLACLAPCVALAACGGATLSDFDGDGSIDSADCAPEDPNIHPAATEACDDGIDNDCDNWTDCADVECSVLDECDSGDDDDSVVGDDDTSGDDDSAGDDDDDTSGDDDSAGDDDDDTSGDDDDSAGDDDDSASVTPTSIFPQGITMLGLAHGTFQMGCTTGQQTSTSCEADESPPHQVTLTRDFWLSKTEITQGQWQSIMGTNPNPSHFGPNGSGTNCGADCPVESVNWWEAAAFADYLSEAEDLPICYTLTNCSGGIGQGMNCGDVLVHSPTGSPYDCAGYRLPTEAEWEYAARAGTDLLYAGSNSLAAVGWFLDNSLGTTHAVDDLLPNAWGLYDMSGNVTEWVWDWYSNDSYTAADTTDPIGVVTGMERVNRGGAWSNTASFSRTSWRNADVPAGAGNSVGIRIARTVPVDADGDGAFMYEDCDESDALVTQGTSELCPGTSCKQLLDDGYANTDGSYWIQPPGAPPLEVYCDMTTDGGGWTLVGMVHPADYPNSVDEEYTWFRDGNNASYLPTYDPEWNQEPSSFGTTAFLAYLDSRPAPVARFHLVSNATPTESQTWFKGAPAAAFSEWFADDVTPTQVCDDVGMSSNCTAPTTIAWPGCGGCSLELGMALTNHGIAGSIHTRLNDVGEGPNTYAGVLTNAGSSGPWSYGGHELTIWIH